MSRNTFILLGLLTGSVAMIGCSKNITAPSVETDRQAQTLASANGCGPAERSPENIQADVEAMEFELPEFKRNTEPASAGSKVGVTGVDEGTVIYDLPEFKKNTEPASAAGKVGATGIDEGTVVYDLPEFKKNTEPASAAGKVGATGIDEGTVVYDLPEFKKNIEPAN